MQDFNIKKALFVFVVALVLALLVRAGFRFLRANNVNAKNRPGAPNVHRNSSPNQVGPSTIGPRPLRKRNK